MSEGEGASFASTGPGQGTPDGPPDDRRVCAWCGTPASLDATTCASCGAALAQRDSIGDLAIAGLTTVDAALLDYDQRPLHIRGPSSSQGVAPAMIVGAVAGGPIGLAAIGGVVAVAAAEYLGTRRDGTGGALDAVGRPSEVVLQALDHLDAEASGSSSEAPAGPTPDAPDDGRSIWRDLPPLAREFEALDDSGNDEEGVPDGR